MKMRSVLRVAAVAVAALAAAAPTAASATRSSAASVRVTLAAGGPEIDGPTQWQPGAVRIAAVSSLADQELTLLHFRPGYTYADFVADGKRADGRGAAAHAAMRRVFAKTVFDGGVDLFRGQSAAFTVFVRPGTYYLGELASRPELTRVTVAGAAGTAAPPAAATVTIRDTGYDVAGALPAAGTITIRNAGTQPHRLNLVPIRTGTTRTQLGAYLRSSGAAENAPPPPFARSGPQLGTAAIGAGERMQLTYRLPAGEYALIDLGQDPNTGRPETLNGLYAVATLG
jgi:hypothetical protein